MPGRRQFLIAGVAALGLAGAAAGLEAGEGAARAAMMRADPERLLADPKLAPVALRIGRADFATHCATCHAGGRANPARGVPDLTDDEHLYGTGRVAEIEQIILYGIRSGHPRGWNLAAMPAYASEKPSSTEPVPPMAPGQIDDVTQFLLAKRVPTADPVAVARGGALYAGTGGCWDCHAADGRGNDAVGAPSLIDGVWLYGDGERESVARSIAYGRHGFSPAFKSMLSAVETRAVAVYVASLARPRKRTS